MGGLNQKVFKRNEWKKVQKYKILTKFSEGENLELNFDIDSVLVTWTSTCEERSDGGVFDTVAEVDGVSLYFFFFYCSWNSSAESALLRNGIWRLSLV